MHNGAFLFVLFINFEGFVTRTFFSGIVFDTVGKLWAAAIVFFSQAIQRLLCQKTQFFLDNQESNGWAKIWQDMGWVCLRDIPPDSYLILIPYIFLFCTPTRLKIVRQIVLKFGWHSWRFDWRT